MLKVALVDNETLKITAGKEYRIYKFMEVNLVIVENDNGDEVIMSRYSFEK